MMQEPLFWQVWGDERKPALVLIHGWGASHQIWLPLVPMLSEHFCLYGVDLPGYGKSPYSGHLSLSEISELIYRQAPKEAVWLGWSLGGLIATQVALEHQHEMKGLITVASSPCFIEQSDWSGMSEPIFVQFQDNLLRLPKKTIEQFLLLQVVGDSQPKMVLQHLKQAANMEINIDVLVDGLEILRQTDLREKLAPLTLPQLCLLGEKDKIVPSEMGQQLLRLSSGSVVVLEGAAHVPFYSQLGEFCDEVNRFVGDVG